MKRILWINNLRAVATFSVILLHTASILLPKYGEIDSYSWWVGNFYDGMSRFCVPIFFMISGALILKNNLDLESFLKKRFIRLLPPVFFWCIFYLTYDLARQLYYGEISTLVESLIFLKNQVVSGVKFHLWFISAIIGLYLFTPIIKVWAQKAKNIEFYYFFFFWIFSSAFSNYDILGFDIILYLNYFTGYLGYFVLGYFLNTRDFELKRFPVFCFILGTLVTIVGTYFVTYKSGNFDTSFYSYLSLNVILTSFGIFTLFKIIPFSEGYLQKVFGYINSHSYGIYLVHILVLSVFSKAGFNIYIFNPIISIPMIAISCLLFSTFLIHMLKKFKWGEVIAG